MVVNTVRLAAYSEAKIINAKFQTLLYSDIAYTPLAKLLARSSELGIK